MLFRSLFGGVSSVIFRADHIIFHHIGKRICGAYILRLSLSLCAYYMWHTRAVQIITQIHCELRTNTHYHTHTHNFIYPTNIKKVKWRNLFLSLANFVFCCSFSFWYGAKCCIHSPYTYNPSSRWLISDSSSNNNNNRITNADAIVFNERILSNIAE